MATKEDVLAVLEENKVTPATKPATTVFAPDAPETKKTNTPTGTTTKAGDYSYTPQYLEELKADPKQVQAIRNLYAIDPNESLLAYFDRTNTKPKGLDPKEEKRQRLFASLGDAALLLTDAMTLGRGGLVPVRKSISANTSATLKAAREKYEAKLGQYNKGRLAAIMQDAASAKDAKTATGEALRKYYGDIDTANRKIRESNQREQNAAAKDASDKAFKADEAEKQRKHNKALNEASNKSREKAAAIRAAAKSDDSEKVTITLTNGDRINIPAPKVGYSADGALIALVQKAAEFDPSDKNLSRNLREAGKSGFPINTMISLLQQSKYANSSEGYNEIIRQYSNYNPNAKLKEEKTDDLKTGKMTLRYTVPPTLLRMGGNTDGFGNSINDTDQDY